MTEEQKFALEWVQNHLRKGTRPAYKPEWWPFKDWWPFGYGQGRGGAYARPFLL